MNLRKFGSGKVFLAALALAGTLPSSRAQVFTYETADLCLGLRKVGSSVDADQDEVVVDIGQASNYVNMSIGSTITVPNISASQLSGSFVGYASIQWSVTGYYLGDTYPNYPTETLWLSVQRPGASVQSAALIRESTSVQQTIKPNITDILGGAKAISTQLGASNQFNTPYLVRESLQQQGSLVDDLLDYNLDDPGEPGFADLKGTWGEGSLESTNPVSFSSSEYLDLYEVRPLTDSHGNLIVDPHTGTNGPAYYLGYFQFTPGGSLSFTRAASSSGTQPPPAPKLSLSLPSGFVENSSKLTISFASTNGSTYTLYSTNSAGLKSTVTKWQYVGSQLGNGGVLSFQDTITTTNRYYAVTVH
jgi:hypothetical protein